jgi:hypothetical protein
MIQCPKCSADIPDDSRFCKSWGESVSTPSQMPTIEAPVAETPMPAETPHVARIISSDQDKPVSFELILPKTEAAPTARMRELALTIGVNGLFVTALASGIFFAQRNLRLGRGDRRNARRLALFVLGLSMLSWIFGARDVCSNCSPRIPLLARRPPPHRSTPTRRLIQP